ncbi:hypothetical protein HBI56_156360 [Parastagonospora nodorum]|uniref:Uncharacterized protein n=2 Tax=Phaeosphaeria nodorum (strain SN15 / ATCC MYA-4574 / FGSC 10173) TaxID=321614 RepID=A0A7U2NP12_PHANO|nr:hypothetical protein SNOG_11236 [Parastagonospora nodorum SN15]KAH3912765.1 hypothetical protein HBH56_119050 [Parastagonospora nodorum]EAT81735.1 hypothetical protein SNOG_11236 [Parastagonospora nodorum SN15]KAH3928772.1 hypothetical protein HBH54_130150 [Parastagonospora nodorum]KAH3950505.1 hypothetical protein HBH53_070440 [Parastagonospora nodorum]KAH3959737.1 hypothetical protein HBH51_197440 [Parastagonospora nodorum]
MPSASEHIEVYPDAIASFGSKIALSTTAEVISTIDGSALADALAFEEAFFANERSDEASVEGDTQSHDDTWVLLRPEGVLRPLAKNKEARSDERNIQTRFRAVVRIRTYVKDNAPNLQSEKSAEWLPSFTASVPATHSFLTPLASDIREEQSAFLQVQKKLIECEELLDILERSLPAETNDPNSVAFTKLAINITRAAIKDAHRLRYKDQQKVEYALGSMDHALCFHEETLRRVNRAAGASDFESFERDVISMEEAIHKRRSGGGG